MSPRPATTPFQEDLYSFLEPVAGPDEELGWPLLIFCGAIASMFDQIELYARDRDDGRPGWSIIMNPDEAPVEALPWLGQFVGVNVKTSLTEQEQRDQIKNLGAFKRGTPAAMKAAAAQTLTGAKTIYFSERAGSAYKLSVATLASETPDAAVVLANLLTQKPAGIIMTYTSITGTDYASFEASHSDYAQITTLYADYAEVLSNPTKN